MWRRYGVGAVLAGSGIGVALLIKKNASPGRQALASKKDEETGRLLDDSTSQTPVSDWSEACKRAKMLAERIKEKSGSPGLLYAVSVDGEIVCSNALGFADVENAVPCNRETRMRIASVSKPVTMLAVARLWEEGKLDLDAPIQRYTSFPEKTFDGKPVTITTRQLVSHIAGIRHYEKKSGKEDNEKDSSQKTTPKQTDKEGASQKDNSEPGENKKASLTYTPGEYSKSEYFIKEHYDSVEKALSIFAYDELMHKPGSKYLYSTHGWTLISAVVEGAAKEKFLPYLMKILHQLGLQYITPEYQQPLIYGRARHYQRKKKGVLRNSPYVDNSYKWAGGGLLSNAEDIVRFGNIMLYCYQATENSTALQRSGDGLSNENACSKPFLKPSTVAKMWEPHPVTVKSEQIGVGGGYGMGWVINPGGQQFGGTVQRPHIIMHAGGAIGGSSVVVIQPEHSSGEDVHKNRNVRGIVVGMICNMESVDLGKTARKIADTFESQKGKQTKC